MCSRVAARTAVTAADLRSRSDQDYGVHQIQSANALSICFTDVLSLRNETTTL